MKVGKGQGAIGTTHYRSRPLLHTLTHIYTHTLSGVKTGQRKRGITQKKKGIVGFLSHSVTVRYFKNEIISDPLWIHREMIVCI